MKKSNKNLITTKEAEMLIELMIRTKNIDRKRLYLANLIRGIFFGFGSFLGASVLALLLYWLLVLLGVVPFIGPLTDSLRESIQSGEGI